MTRLKKAVVEVLEDEVAVEDLAEVEDRLYAITMELYDIMLGTIRTLLQHASIANLMITL